LKHTPTIHSIILITKQDNKETKRVDSVTGKTNGVSSPPAQSSCIKKVLNRVKHLRFDGFWENGFLSFTIVAPKAEYHGRTFVVKPSGNCNNLIKNTIEALQRIKRQEREVLAATMMEVTAKLPDSHKIVDLMMRKYKFAQAIVSALKQANTPEAFYKLVNKRIEKSPVLILEAPGFLKQHIGKNPFVTLPLVLGGEALVGKTLRKALTRKAGITTPIEHKSVAIYVNNDEVFRIVKGLSKLEPSDVKNLDKELREILEHEWVHVIQMRKSRNLKSTPEQELDYYNWREDTSIDKAKPDYNKFGGKIYQAFKPYNKAYSKKLLERALTTVQLQAELEGISLKKYLTKLISQGGIPKKKLKTLTAQAMLQITTSKAEYKSRTIEIQAYATNVANLLIDMYNAGGILPTQQAAQLGDLIGFYMSTWYVDGGKTYKYFVKNLVQAIKQRVKDPKSVKEVISLYNKLASGIRKQVKLTLDIEAERIAQIAKLIEARKANPGLLRKLSKKARELVESLSNKLTRVKKKLRGKLKEKMTSLKERLVSRVRRKMK